MTHMPPAPLMRKRIHVAVIGCGGTGSAVLAGLPYLHQALLAYGHQAGLHVTVYDGDRITENNCVRQPFARSETGLHKCMVLVNRLNLFWGLDWTAVPRPLTECDTLDRADLVLGCVDTRSARAVISDIVTRRTSGIFYWLDVGNNSDSGQFVLGQPLNGRNRRSSLRLRTVAELYPGIVDPALDDDALPSCSAAEALDKQHPYINPVLANQALALLSRLFRYGADYHGAFVNLATGRSASLLIDPRIWKRIARHRRKAASKAEGR